jgi:hypothetical protein
MKGHFLMLAPETADDIRAKIGSLLSLDESEVVSFYTFSHLEDRCVRLMLKAWPKRTYERS